MKSKRQIIPEDRQEPQKSKVQIKMETLSDLPYSLQKIEQYYRRYTDQMLGFFTVSQMQKYVDYKNKSKRQREIMEDILRQLREFLRKKNKVTLIKIRNSFTK